MMAKPLAKGRKASKLEDVARVKGESCHELSAEPRPPRLGSTAHIAPVANSHVVGVGSEGDDLHATMEVHTCDPCDFEEEPSSVEDTVPDQSTLGTHYNEARAFQHGVPANPLNLSFENPWSPSLAFAREPSAHDHSLPVQGLNDSLQRTLQYRYKPASMDPSQTASSRRNSAMYMAERNQVTRMSNLRNNPLGSPRAPSQDKTEQAYKSVFSGSVSELDFGTDSDWQTTNMWDTSQFASDSSAYTGFNNPNVSITSIQDSDSGGYSNSSFGSGQMDTWSQGNPNMGPFHYQGWEEGIQQTLRLQANSASRYFATSPQSTYGNPNLQARPS